MRNVFNYGCPKQILRDRSDQFNRFFVRRGVKPFGSRRVPRIEVIDASTTPQRLPRTMNLQPAEIKQLLRREAAESRD